jgi:hypothetical protein
MSSKNEYANRLAKIAFFFDILLKSILKVSKRGNLHESACNICAKVAYGVINIHHLSW